MSSTPFKLAILECDQPLDAARQGLGGHTGVWRTVFRQAATSLYKPLDLIEPIRYNAEEALPTLDGSIDGVLISGSRYNAWADDPWIVNLVQFTKECIEKKIPVIGICFGHQIIGRALGSEVNRNEAGWEIAPTELTLNELGKEIFRRDTLTLHLMNRDIVRSCPPGYEVLASSSITPIHSLYKQGEIFTVQGHPEFSAAITGELLKMRHDSGIVPDDTFEDASKRLNNEHDGVVVGRALLRFLGLVTF